MNGTDKKICQMKYGEGIVAIIMCVTMVLSACGGDYLPEKYFYKANKKASHIDLKTATDGEIKEVIDAYRYITRRFPVSGFARNAHFEIAYIYIAQNKFDEARDELENVVLNFSRDTEKAADAKFLIGQLYERQGKKADALLTYREVFQLYPLTKTGLNAPLYVVQFLRNSNDIEGAQRAYEEAIIHYGKKIDELGDITAAAILQHHIALTYAMQGLWADAAVEWEKIPTIYSQSDLVPMALLTLGEVYFTKLKERSKAVDVYERVVKMYPGTPFAKQAMVKLIQMYFLTKEYDKVKEWCQALITIAGDDRELAAQAYIILARSIEKQGDWEAADALYADIEEKYADTVTALRIPLFRAFHFQQQADLDEVEKIYDDTLVDYDRILKNEKTSTKVKENALNLMNLIHVQRGDWQDIASNMKGVLAQPDVPAEKKAYALYVLGYIHQIKLNDAVTAKSYYTQLIEEYPTSPLVSNAQKLMESPEPVVEQ